MLQLRYEIQDLQTEIEEIVTALAGTENSLVN